MIGRENFVINFGRLESCESFYDRGSSSIALTNGMNVSTLGVRMRVRDCEGILGDARCTRLRGEGVCDLRWRHLYVVCVCHSFAVELRLGGECFDSYI
jgi:hypothetical protein